MMREGWLLVRRELGTGAVKYLISNAPADADTDCLVRLDAKSCLGMHQFQVRMWCARHHHMALVMLSYVLAKTMWRLCRGTLPLMSQNDVVFVAVEVRLRPARMRRTGCWLCCGEGMGGEGEAWSGNPLIIMLILRHS